MGKYICLGLMAAGAGLLLGTGFLLGMSAWVDLVRSVTGLSGGALLLSAFGGLGGACVIVGGACALVKRKAA
jgi:hypothetical protein